MASLGESLLLSLKSDALELEEKKNVRKSSSSACPKLGESCPTFLDSASWKPRIRSKDDRSPVAPPVAQNDARLALTVARERLKNKEVLAKQPVSCGWLAVLNWSSWSLGVPLAFGGCDQRDSWN